MSSILYYLGSHTGQEVCRSLASDSRNSVKELSSRRVQVTRRDLLGRVEPKQYQLFFSKTLTETLLVLRRQYISLVLIDMRGGNREEEFAAIDRFLIPLLRRIEEERDVERRFALHRLVAVVGQNRWTSELAFELGKLQIGACLPDPFFQGRLFSLVDHLVQSSGVRGKTALCLAGGGLEGLLYELGVLHALNSILQNSLVTMGLTAEPRTWSWRSGRGPPF